MDSDSEPGERLGTGKEAEVFAHGEHVLKRCRKPWGKQSVFREAAALAAIEGCGLPAPKVVEVGAFGDGWGLVMTRASGRPFAESMLADRGTVGEHLAAMAALQRDIHAQRVPALRSLKARLADNIRRAAQLDDGLRRSLLDGLAAMPDGDRLCHGDFHPFNVMGTVADAMVIDWPDAATGAPEADLCRSYVLMHHVDPELAARYVAAYGASGEVWRWLPYVAAARLTEDVPDEEPSLLAFAAGRVP